VATGAPGIPLRPGVEPLLREARASGLRLAIATTTSPENVSALLRAGLRARCSKAGLKIGAGDTVPEQEAGAGHLPLGAERLGLPADACLAFEDSGNGLKGQPGAGLATVVTRRRIPMTTISAAPTPCSRTCCPTWARCGAATCTALASMSICCAWHDKISDKK
jgi:beta-phosphoglucomutase-like phosphatase (HAD superfamily)